MQNSMIQLSIAMIFGVALCVTVKAADPDSGSDQSLLAIMDQVAGLAREAVPLAKQELAVLDQKFKGDQYNNLIARLNTPMKLANGLWSDENMQAFRDRVKAKDKRFVAETVLATLDQLRGLDGVMLAEAAAGSPQQGRLLDLYQRQEGALSGLNGVHQEWSNR